MKQELEELLKKYLMNKYYLHEDDEIERIISGVFAFIAVQAWEESYIPFNFNSETKHWWEFWK